MTTSPGQRVKCAAQRSVTASCLKPGPPHREAYRSFSTHTAPPRPPTLAPSRNHPRGQLREPHKAAATTRQRQESALVSQQLRLIHPADPPGPTNKLLVYLPGTDGTGQAVLPQIPGLHAAGFDVYCLAIPPSDRSGWSQLTVSTAGLIRQLLDIRAAGPGPGPALTTVTLVGESFGGVLGLRLARAAPHLVAQLVLVNPATCFGQSLSGLPALLSSTNLLGLFPQAVYQAAQLTMLPLLVDSSRITAQAAELMRAMIEMKPASGAYGSRPVVQIASPSLTPRFSSPSPPAPSPLPPPSQQAWHSGSASTPSPTPPSPSPSPSPALPAPAAPDLVSPAAAVSLAGGWGSSPSPAPDGPGLSRSWAGSGAGSGAGSWGGGSHGPARRSPSPPPAPLLVSQPWAPSAAAAAANFRANLLRQGAGLTDTELRAISSRVLIISSARDRLLPSIQEGARLQRHIPGSQRVVLPNSGHAALLERGVDLAALMAAADMTAAHAAAKPMRPPGRSRGPPQVGVPPQLVSRALAEVQQVPGSSSGSSRAGVEVAGGAGAGGQGLGGGLGGVVGGESLGAEVGVAAVSVAAAAGAVGLAAVGLGASALTAAGAAGAAGAQATTRSGHTPDHSSTQKGPTQAPGLAASEAKLSSHSGSEGDKGSGHSSGSLPPSDLPLPHPLPDPPRSTSSHPLTLTPVAGGPGGAAALPGHPQPADTPLSPLDGPPFPPTLPLTPSPSPSHLTSTPAPPHPPPGTPTLSDSQGESAAGVELLAMNQVPSSAADQGLTAAVVAAAGSGAAAAAGAPSAAAAGAAAGVAAAASAAIAATATASAGMRADGAAAVAAAAAAAGQSSSQGQGAVRRRAGQQAAAARPGTGAEGAPPVEEVEGKFDEWAQLLGPWRDLVSPVLLGAENLPMLGSEEAARPMLFVGNHQRMGLYDTPLLVYELAVRGYKVRGLAHPKHWSGPVGPFFEQFGAVKASPMAAFRLLKQNEKVLLFPGGAREVNKPRGSEYRLLWKEGADFVRLAAKCGALIVPFAAVGADDAYDVMLDADEVAAHPVLGPLARQVFGAIDPDIDVAEALLPLTRLPVVGIPTPIPVPNLNRLYFKIAPPVDTRQLTNLRDAAGVQALYDDVKHTVERCMGELLVYRDQDEESDLGGRFRRTLGRWTNLVRDTTTGDTASKIRS